MFRYVYLCFFFLLTILICFWIFAWKWRTEIVAAFLERSCAPCKAHVEQVEWVSRDTLKISGIHLYKDNDGQVLHISEAQLTTPFCSWVYWFLVPSNTPLPLSRLTLHVDKINLPPFDSFNSPVPITVEKLVIITPDGTEETFSHESDLLSTLSSIKP